jgi:hypothetical protein
MDRLMEANKVATLMRRRENLKPITLVQPESSSALDSRSYPAAQIATIRGAVMNFRPMAAALPVTTVIHSEPACLQPRTPSVLGKRVSRLMEQNGARMSRGTMAVPRAPRKMKSRASVQRAQLTMPRTSVPPPKTGHRLFDVLQIGRRKPSMAKSLLSRRAAVYPPFSRSCEVRTLAVDALVGKDQRKSRSQGFRPPQLRRRPVVIAPRRRSALDWNDDPRKLDLTRLFPAPPPPLAAQAMPTREPRFPGAPGPFTRGGKEWPVARPPIISESSAQDTTAPVVTVSAVRWNTTPLESSLRCEWYRSSPAIMFGYSKDKEKQERGPAAAAEAPKTPVPADVRLEEHFASGCGNWVGNVADWRLDAAGARTGSLALFSPSLELVDYDMEFLVRVEKSSVTWVFRASDTNDYYRAVLRVNPEGGYLFERSSVAAGVPGPAVTKPVQVTSNARTALAVRTSVKGKDFAVFLEGQAVDSWSDDRLPMGGVGFGSAPDDRARLYWMRLTYSGSPGLKDVKR